VIKLCSKLSAMIWILTVALMMAAPPVQAQDAAPSAPAATGAASVAQTAPTLAALLAELPGADYDRKGEIVNAIAASGNERADIILNALSEGTLFADGAGHVVIGDTAPVDALTGKPAANVDSATLDKVGVNNRLRRGLRGLIARLQLESPKAEIRRAAAKAAFQARDMDSLDAINAALLKEKDSGIHKLLEQAHAAIVLQDDTLSEQDQLAAVAALRDRSDNDAVTVLTGLSEGRPEAVKKAAADTISTIQSSLVWWSALQNVYYGLSLGSVLLLAGVGLAITFGVMGVINMAHGEMIMLGAYTTYVVQQIIQSAVPDLMPYSLLIAVPAAFLVSGGAGVVVERSIIRFLYGRPLETLLATWGLSLILQQVVRSIFGATNKPVISPSWMTGSFTLGQLDITYARLWIIVFALVVLAALMVFLKHSYFGMQMRAVTQNRKMAAAMGVRTNWVDALTFGLGSGVAGIAGVALSQIDNVSPNLGQSYIIDSFMVVVFGGVGNLWGTLVGAGTLGIANKMLEPYAGAVFAKILVLVFIILFIQRRPRGLFALKGRAVEA
jgi:urea transport system permease protein